MSRDVLGLALVADEPVDDPDIVDVLTDVLERLVVPPRKTGTGLSARGRRTICPSQTVTQ